MSRRAATAGPLLVLLLALAAASPGALADGPTTVTALTLTVYLDGYVLVVHDLALDASYPAVNVSLLGAAQSFLVVDEQELLLDFTLGDGWATVDSLGCSWMRASYFTPDLTAKTGKYWTLRTQVPINTTVVLPEGTSIISLNVVPELIESTGDQVTVVMPAGLVDVTYLATRSLSDEPAGSGVIVPLVAALAILVPAGVALVLLRRRGKPGQAPQGKASAVDLAKLLKQERDLRAEEVQAVRFLAEKNGRAFEAEIFERLSLPRTTTWRLLKRLEAMGIVEIRKTRRQNLVSIRPKYLKRQRADAA